MHKDNPQDILRERIIFYPVIVLSAIFCVSIFIVIAATFGDQTIPVNRWVNKNANWILLLETVLLVIATLSAMTIDRIRTLRRMDHQKSESLSEASSDVD